MQRYITRNYEQFTQPTVGSMFFCKKINKGDKTYELQIWDTAGQEKFRSITPLYFRDANGVILVCDLTSQSSFNSLREWVKLLEEQGPKKLAKIILGNKVDLEDKLKITEPELKQFADSVNSPYMLTSALNDTGIDRAFDKVIENIEHYRTVIQGSMITGGRAKNNKKEKDCKC